MDTGHKSWIPYPLWIKKKREEAEQKAKEEAEHATEKTEEEGKTEENMTSLPEGMCIE